MYTFEKQEKDNIKITMTFTKEEWEGFVEKSYEKNKGKFSVEGFRKGHVPKAIVEKNYGESVFFDDALDMAFADEYNKVLAEHLEFDPIDQPEINIEKFDETGLTMVAIVPNMPEVQLGDYTSITVEAAKGEVTDEQVEKELRQAQERGARFVSVEREAKMGDIATIDFVGSVNGKKFDGGAAEDHRLELGSHSFIDTFEDQIVGMKIGQTKDVFVKFPDKYHSQDLCGKEAIFSVTLKKVEEKQLPELNDEFASNCSEFDTLKAFKKDIRKHQEESLKAKLDRETENKLIACVVEKSSVEIPECLILRQLDLFIRDFEMRLSYQGFKLEDYAKMTNTTVEELKNSKRDQAEESVKTRLVLEAIIKKENLSLTDEEVDAKLSETAKRYQKTLEEYKTSLGEKQLAYYKNEILMDKLMAFLKDKNTIV